MCRFEHILPRHVCQAIRRVNIHQFHGQDLPAWRWSSNGEFSLSSAYKQLLGAPQNHDKHRWRCIWKLKVPQRYRTFLWLCFHGRLMTNLLRFYRGSHPTGNCGICYNSQESMLHLLRDCPEISKLWDDFLPPSLHNQFFHYMDRNDWFTWCLRRKDKVQGFEFRLWFTVICRYIWLARNDRCFNNISWSSATILARARACLSWGNTNLIKNQNEMERSSQWNPPPIGWVKINTDGSRNDNSGMCTCGGVLRDHNGKFLQGYMYRIGQGTVVSAEAWGVLWGLKLAWDRGYRRILVESDCMEVIELIQDTVSQEHPDFNLIEEVRMLLNRQWEVNILWCARDVNTVAHVMAREAWSMMMDIYITESPPDGIRRLLFFDKEESRMLFDSGG